MREKIATALENSMFKGKKKTHNMSNDFLHKSLLEYAVIYNKLDTVSENKMVEYELYC